MCLQLIKGRAEIFGFELVEGKVYLFAFECKAAVYTWQGCVLEMSIPPQDDDRRLIFMLHVTGDPSTEYVSDETPMRTYANLHVALEQMRVSALCHIRGISVPPREKSNWEPPRVLVVGPEHSGKTTVCKILTNYAARAGQNWSPFFVNVDPSEVRC